MPSSWAQQGALNVLGIVSDIRNPVAVAAIDAIDTAYGHATIPLGAVAHSDLLWRAFGIPAELAWFAMPLLIVGGGAVVFARMGRERCRARRRA